MDTALIVNTLAGERSRSRNVALIDLLNQRFLHDVVPFKVNTLEELNSAIEQIRSNGASRLLVAGGDGTLNRVVNAILKRADDWTIPLGLIPYGTGNSFALDLGIHSLEDALQAITSGDRVNVNIGRISNDDGSRYFINNFGVGLVYDIASMASKMRFLGAFSYTLATLIRIIRLKPWNLSLTIDGQPSERSVLFLDICNSQYTGGAMRIAPQVSLTDGRFQMIGLADTTRRSLLAAFPKLFAGEHLSEPFVTSEFVKRLDINADRETASLLDGELSLKLPVTVEMTERTLPFFSQS